MQPIPHPSHALLARRFTEDEEIPDPRSIVKLRLPSPISGPGSVISASAVSGATQSTYHSALVRYSLPDFARRCTTISVWPIPAYSSAVVRAASPAAWMREQPGLFQDANIPFPCPQDQRDPRAPPARFGAPVALPGFQDRRPAWILMEAQTFDLPFTKAWKRYTPLVRVSVADMGRLEAYATLLSHRAAAVSLTLLPPPAPLETGLFARLFGTGPVIRLGSEDDAEDEDGEDGDGFEFLRMLAGRSGVVREVVERHAREKAEMRDEIVRRWIVEM